MSQVTQAEEQPGSRRARGGRIMARGLKNPMISVAVNRLSCLVSGQPTLL